MEIINFDTQLAALKSYWEAQSIYSTAKPIVEISFFSFGDNFSLPTQFVKYFSVINGMESLYPNNFDKEGFLFYPLHGLLTTDKEFADAKEKDILLIANYMHKSWWYGLKMINRQDYVIGIIPEKDKFKPLANSLSEFIGLYLNNSSDLYDYT